jgi:uncharacterized protein
MMLDKERFLTDRPYATGWVMYCSLFVLGLLSLFLFVKTVTDVAELVDGKNDGTYPNSISITGEGEVAAVPDVAKFNFSVRVTAPTVEAAQQEAAKKSNAALDLLKKSGIAEKDIKTTAVNVYPHYEYSYCQTPNCSNEPKVTGHDADQSFTVTVRDIVTKPKLAGELMIGIGAVGVTDISTLEFTVDNPEALQAEARSKAIADARTQAKQLAKDLGVRLDDVISFSEENMGGYPDPYYMRAEGDMGMSAKAVTPDLPTGENTFNSRVYVTYKIK